MDKVLGVGKTLLIFQDKSTVILNWGFIQWAIFSVISFCTLWVIGNMIYGSLYNYIQGRVRQKRAGEAIKDLQDNPVDDDDPISTKSSTKTAEIKARAITN
jgi:hypothetical protein